MQMTYSTQVAAQYWSIRCSRGSATAQQDTSKKDSYDLTIGPHPEWHDVGNLMMTAVAQHLTAYIDQYRALVLGALAPMVAHPRTGEPTALSLANFDECGKPHLVALMQSMYRCGGINLQKYLRGSGGYHHWHSEVYPQNASCETLHRVLLFQFYLNDVAEGRRDRVPLPGTQGGGAQGAFDHRAGGVHAYAQGACAGQWGQVHRDFVDFVQAGGGIIREGGGVAEHW
jgi:hypothetical protein